MAASTRAALALTSVGEVSPAARCGTRASPAGISVTAAGGGTSGRLSSGVAERHAASLGASTSGLSGTRVIVHSPCQAAARRCSRRTACPSALLGGGAELPHGEFKRPQSWRRNELLLLLEETAQPLENAALLKETSDDAVDAMKRTISGMLGLLPSAQFSISLETGRDTLARLLISSVMTGYTLRNAETRLGLQRALDGPEAAEPLASEAAAAAAGGVPSAAELLAGAAAAGGARVPLPELPPESELEAAAPRLREYVASLRGAAAAAAAELRCAGGELRAARAELAAARRAVAALERLRGAERNPLLEYLRSLPVDKVQALSKPGSAELEQAVQGLVAGLLGTLHAVGGPGGAAAGFGAASGGGGGGISAGWPLADAEEAAAGPPDGRGAAGGVGGFHTRISATRDYLARLLFWAMLMGHRARRVEYRLELARAYEAEAADPVAEGGGGGGGAPGCGATPGAAPRAGGGPRSSRPLR